MCNEDLSWHELTLHWDAGPQRAAERVWSRCVASVPDQLPRGEGGDPALQEGGGLCRGEGRLPALVQRLPLPGAECAAPPAAARHHFSAHTGELISANATEPLLLLSLLLWLGPRKCIQPPACAEPLPLSPL